MANPRSPWEEQSQEVDCMHKIMMEEGEESDFKLAHKLQQELNMNDPNLSFDYPASSSNEVFDHSVNQDEALARKLQEQFDNEESGTMDDALMAAMMQQEIDDEIKASEQHRNGNCKVRLSSFQTEYLEHHPDVSEETEMSYYEYEDLDEIPGSLRTKHDKATGDAKNKKKITDSFNIEFSTGDFRGITVPHKVYNELQVEAHKSKFNGIRVKDRRDVSTHEKVLDKKTRVVMLKMLNSGIVKKINGIVSSGKESVIIHCNGGRHTGKNAKIPVPSECVFKIHKTSLNEFSRRRDYIDSRYTSVINSKTKKLIEVWALKEVHNLNRLRRAGIMCPEVVAHRKQLLLLSFIGCDNIPAQTLAEAVFSSDQLKSAYQQLLSGMKAMFTMSKLVHADLSEYNLLWFNGVLHFIDLSQAVLTDHPAALTYLYRDCMNMHKYFLDRNLKNLMDPRQMFCHVTEMDVKYSDEPTFITQIEHLQRQEVHDFKHGKTSTDYAFETSFNDTINSDSDGEEEDEVIQKGENSTTCYTQGISSISDECEVNKFDTKTG